MGFWKARVYIGGLDTGIVETNQEFAEKYWADRQRIIKFKVELRRI